jgi:multisubunit Na+/H+ antiporter MnhG subunit
VFVGVGVAVGVGVVVGVLVGVGVGVVVGVLVGVGVGVVVGVLVGVGVGVAVGVLVGVGVCASARLAARHHARARTAGRTIFLFISNPISAHRHGREPPQRQAMKSRIATRKYRSGLRFPILTKFAGRSV